MPSLWRWTAVLIHALRQALCPSPGLLALIEANAIRPDDVASVFFSTTQDLNAEFPAVAARDMGWSHAALMCAHEMYVPGSLPMCVRVLLHVNTAKTQDEVRFVYLRGATALRPDLNPGK